MERLGRRSSKQVLPVRQLNDFLVWPRPPEELVNHPERWATRLMIAVNAGLLDVAAKWGVKPTPYAVEAYHYWQRAAVLQTWNIDGKPPSWTINRWRTRTCGDDLQDAIPIYDTVRRRYAGFSNVLEQLRYGRDAPKYAINEAKRRPTHQFDALGRMVEWFYLCLVHRMTGSGASFEHDHGWRNTIAPELAKCRHLEAMADVVRRHPGPAGTSIGNQYPAVSKTKPLNGARNHLQRYLAEDGVKLTKQMVKWLEAQPQAVGIKEAVNQALEINTALGEKRFSFQLTAWIMDMAEYFPILVDPTSDCFHGKNAQEALNVCFAPVGMRGRSQTFFDAGTRVFCELTGTNPMDVEDAAPGCDLIRWLENYVPKKGFNHVLIAGVRNSSSLRYFKGKNNCLQVAKAVV